VSGGIAPRIFNLGGLMEVSGQIYALAALPQGKSPRLPLDMRLGGPHRRYGHGGEEKISHNCPCRKSNTRSSRP